MFFLLDFFFNFLDGWLVFFFEFIFVGKRLRLLIFMVFLFVLVFLLWFCFNLLLILFLGFFIKLIIRFDFDVFVDCFE